MAKENAENDLSQLTSKALKVLWNRKKLKKQFTDLASLKVSKVKAEECRAVKSFDCGKAVDRTRTHETFISRKITFS